CSSLRSEQVDPHFVRVNSSGSSAPHSPSSPSILILIHPAVAVVSAHFARRGKACVDDLRTAEGSVYLTPPGSSFLGPRDDGFNRCLSPPGFRSAPQSGGTGRS